MAGAIAWSRWPRSSPLEITATTPCHPAACRHTDEGHLAGRMEGLAHLVEDCGYPDFLCLQVGVMASAAGGLQAGHCGRHPDRLPPDPLLLTMPAGLLANVLPARPALLQEVSSSMTHLFKANGWMKRYTAPRRSNGVPPVHGHTTLLLVKKTTCAAKPCQFAVQLFPSHLCERPLPRAALSLGAALLAAAAQPPAFGTESASLPPPDRPAPACCPGASPRPADIQLGQRGGRAAVRGQQPPGVARQGRAGQVQREAAGAEAAGLRLAQRQVGAQDCPAAARRGRLRQPARLPAVLAAAAAAFSS